MFSLRQFSLGPPFRPVRLMFCITCFSKQKSSSSKRRFHRRILCRIFPVKAIRKWRHLSVCILLHCIFFVKFIEVMEELQLHYSQKGIPIQLERSYKLQLIDKIDQVIERMRWKAFFYMNRSENTQETYGLKSLNCPQKIIEIVPFKKDLWNLV